MGRRLGGPLPPGPGPVPQRLASGRGSASPSPSGRVSWAPLSPRTEAAGEAAGATKAWAPLPAARACARAARGPPLPGRRPALRQGGQGGRLFAAALRQGAASAPTPWARAWVRPGVHHGVHHGVQDGLQSLLLRPSSLVVRRTTSALLRAPPCPRAESEALDPRLPPPSLELACRERGGGEPSARFFRRPGMPHRSLRRRRSMCVGRSAGRRELGPT